MKKNLPIEFDIDSYKRSVRILNLLPTFIIKRYFYQVSYNYKRGEIVELNIINLLNLKSVFIAEFSSAKFDLIKDSDDLEQGLASFAANWLNETLPIVNSLYSEKNEIFSAPGKRLLIVIDFFYSVRNQRDVFNPITSDWQEEYFEALFKKEIWKARWINLRYTYAFLVTMWQKSPIGDLIEFISKIAK